MKTDFQKTLEWRKRSRLRQLEKSKSEVKVRIQRRALKVRIVSRKKTVDGDDTRDIKDECDQLVRDILKIRDVRCFTCPRTDGLQVGHLFRRGIERTRWSLINNHAQCERCNVLHETLPEIYQEAFMFTFSDSLFWALKSRSEEPGKFSYTELLSIRDNLRAELAEQKRKAA